MKEILLVIIQLLSAVESNYDADAINISENAVGILQIRPILVDDINRIFNRDFIYDDRYDVQKSLEMCALYLLHYHDKYVTYNPNTEISDYEICARLWNGGYEGLKRNPSATNKYWSKVNKYWSKVTLLKEVK